ncbi:MAG: CDP-diacylglycerol--glycerol-3-phosphate 3-phosphatidyltransferase [Candidatus Symbiodolus clandestinus]
MPINIPILLTLLRIALIPFFVLFFYVPTHWGPPACAGLFVLAAITDWCDGFLARYWHQTTPFGVFLDPVADKIMVATALVLIATRYHTVWITLPSAIMIVREIIISALREWMAEFGQRYAVPVHWIGKIKTAAQMIALTILLWRPSATIEIFGFIALYVATLLTFWSMLYYLRAAQQSFNSNRL